MDNEDNELINDIQNLIDLDLIKAYFIDGEIRYKITDKGILRILENELIEEEDDEQYWQ